MNKIYIFTLFAIAFLSCKSAAENQKADENPTQKQLTVPAFNSDSAYQYVKTQVDFGPRVPNTAEHRQCAAYLSASLKRFGAVVVEQKMNLQAYDGTILKSVNIIGSYNPEAKNRILLFAHWDCRPYSDQDADSKNFNKPVMGANDGASGVGVLLELARQINLQKTDIGVDIAFFDAEDYGAPETFVGNSEDTWCLGTQYWAKNPHVAGYNARYGILLDMVGAPGATFYKEQISEYYASSVVKNVWDKAAALGFSQYFINQSGGGITDDHVYVNKIAGIPSIDIIHYSPNNEHGFGDYWHTTHDTMENIDKNTLYAVGTTLLHVIYSEK